MDDIPLPNPEYFEHLWIALKHSLIVTAILMAIFSYPIYLTIKDQKKAFKIRAEYNDGINGALTSKHARFLLDSYIREMYKKTRKGNMVAKYGNTIHADNMLQRLQERVIVLEQLKL